MRLSRPLLAGSCRERVRPIAAGDVAAALVAATRAAASPGVQLLASGEMQGAAWLTGTAPRHDAAAAAAARRPRGSRRDGRAAQRPRAARAVDRGALSASRLHAPLVRAPGRHDRQPDAAGRRRLADVRPDRAAPGTSAWSACSSSCRRCCWCWSPATWSTAFIGARIVAALHGGAGGGRACAALGPATHAVGRELLLAVSVALGAVRAFQMPAQQALTPMLLPPALLPRGMAFSSAGMQGAIIAGPALGGFLYVAGAARRLRDLRAALRRRRRAGRRRALRAGGARQEGDPLDTLLAGVRFMRDRPVVLGAISLDLFAVLLGGAVALLPIFARDILHVGPWGLGLLRAAPAVGAFVMSIAADALADHAPRRPRAALGGGGVRRRHDLAFGLSTSFVLSLVALVVSGAADMVSVVIRQTLVQLDTPDEMRGRVSAVNSVFIGATNQLGEFESGVTAACSGRSARWCWAASARCSSPAPGAPLPGPGAARPPRRRRAEACCARDAAGAARRRALQPSPRFIFIRIRVVLAARLPGRELLPALEPGQRVAAGLAQQLLEVAQAVGVDAFAHRAARLVAVACSRESGTARPASRRRRSSPPASPRRRRGAACAGPACRSRRRRPAADAASAPSSCACRGCRARAPRRCPARRRRAACWSGSTCRRPTSRAAPASARRRRYGRSASAADGIGRVDDERLDARRDAAAQRLEPLVAQRRRRRRRRRPWSARRPARRRSPWTSAR